MVKKRLIEDGDVPNKWEEYVRELDRNEKYLGRSMVEEKSNVEKGFQY